MTRHYHAIVRSLIIFAAALTICHCGVPQAPQCRILPFRSRGESAALINEARQAWDDLGRSGSTDARERYNQAIAKLIDQIRCGPGTRRDKALAMGTEIDTSHSLGAGVRFEELDAFIPASEVSTKEVGERHSDPGIGIPMVGWISYDEETKASYPFAPPTGLPFNLTTILDFNRSKPTWRVFYPGSVESISVNGRDEAVAVDWSAPGALYWRMSDLDDLDLAKVLLPGRFTNQTNLYAAAPYDPDKIPVVLVHGLYSSPGTYKVMYNDLMSESWFRENYQPWFFSYPTGTSWVYNAAWFREHLDHATEEATKHGTLRNWNNMVLIGHSMGGVISHASLVDPGTRFYDSEFGKPLDQLKASENAKQVIEWVTLYKPVTEPTRMIFMAAPHRGSPSANRFFSRWISNLIRLPKTLTVDFIDVTMTELGNAVADGGNGRPIQTSIGTLAPNFKGYDALNASPMRPELTVHSIVGDRGKNNTPDSSDGIVPYWSSHLDNVESELVVPYGHSMTGKPETIAEIKRILKLHLKQR